MIKRKFAYTFTNSFCMREKQYIKKKQYIPSQTGTTGISERTHCTCCRWITKQYRL